MKRKLPCLALKGSTGWERREIRRPKIFYGQPPFLGEFHVLTRTTQNFPNVDTLRYKNYIIICILGLFR